MPTHRALPKVIAICFVLGAITWIVFGQTLSFEFVNFDDSSYVYRNFDVTRGLSLAGVKWAFTHVVGGNWHPLTVLSHMLDCRLYGVVPNGHHFTNVLLHMITVIVLFLLLHWMTSTLWQSAFVSAAFAIHPLHVESVAWIAERKDVLSGLFFMLTLAAYVHYTHKRTIGRYLLMSILFACGLMAKPMLVTLPFVLLLLDYWPLKRLSLEDGQSVRKLFFEKVPLFAFSMATSAIALTTQHPSLNALNKLPILSRLANVFVATLIYIRQMFFPHDLACFYPYSHNLPPWEIIISITALVTISVGAWAFRKRMPYLLTGWLWYLGMLMPVVGIIQVGGQAHADRYTYLPQIGLYLAVAWGIKDFSSARPYQRVILTSLAAAAIIALAWSASIQTSYWRNSIILWQHSLSVTPNNAPARQNLCDALFEQGEIDDAMVQVQEGLKLQPTNANLQNSLGAVLTRKGKLDEALLLLESALRINPHIEGLRYNLANVFLQQGRVDEAIANYEMELISAPNFPEGHNNLAKALFQKGRLKEGEEQVRIALALNPRSPEAHNNLGIALSQKGEISEAVAQWKKTLEIQPDNLEAHCNLAWVLSTSPDGAIRNGRQALEHAQRALQLSGENNPRIWRLAAAAYAENGRFTEAIHATETALKLARTQGNETFAAVLEANIEQYRQDLPLRDTSSH